LKLVRDLVARLPLPIHEHDVLNLLLGGVLFIGWNVVKIHSVRGEEYLGICITFFYLVFYEIL
jgi:hypothetical protein